MSQKRRLHFPPEGKQPQSSSWANSVELKEGWIHVVWKEKNVKETEE